MIIEDITSGGGWFKAEEHADDAAFLIEVHDFERQRPTNYGPKDSALCDVTVFATEDDVEALEPTQILNGVRIEYTVLAPDLAPLVGKATIQKLAQVQGKRPGSKPAWVWRSPSAAIKAKVAEYATKREEELQAAVDAAPDFDD